MDDDDELRKRRQPDLNITEDTECFLCGRKETTKWFKYPDHINWDGEHVRCNICYQKKYHIDRHDIIKKNNEKSSYMTNWKNGELDPYIEQGKGYIVEWFVCKTLEVKNRNIEENTFLAKCDTLRHEKYGDIEIKSRSYDSKHKQWQQIISDSEINHSDTLLFTCMDEYIPWKNVRRMYAIPSLKFENINNFTVYESNKSKWEEFRIDKEPFNKSYHDLTIEDCPALRKDKWKEWLRLMKEV